jgi:hypothetical protein
MADLTRHTLEVLAYGLALKDRVMAGDDTLVLDAENGRLREMLWADGPVRGHPDYADAAPRPVTPEYPGFLGVRYALACWLDEILISDPDCPWRDEWAEKSLESALYGGSNERAWRFWVQAELAEKRSGAEAVEAYLWCVMLGFRGTPVNVRPPEWVEGVRRRVQAAKQREFALPADLGLKLDVPVQTGRDAFRRAARLLAVVAAAGLFAAVILIVQRLNPG